MKTLQTVAAVLCVTFASLSLAPPIRAGENAKLAAADDAELNEVYKKALAAMPDAEVKKLRVSQHAWIAFRDKEIARQEAVSNPQVVFAELTEKRTEVLRAWIKAKRVDE
jgi:uncharacterized protein YecT (DUF1311 family)